MKKIIRIISLGLAFCLLALSLCSCDPPDTRSDEKKIQDRLDAFVFALNSGDTDAALECLDAKNRNMLNAALNIGGGLLNSLIGFNIDVKDILALAIGLNSGDLFTANVQDISITSDTKAVAYLTLTTQIGGQTESESGTLDLVKEKGDWYIHFEVDWTSLIGSF